MDVWDKLEIDTWADPEGAGGGGGGMGGSPFPYSGKFELFHCKMPTKSY